MSSGAGAFCPGWRRLECLLVFLPWDLLEAELVGFTALRAGFAGFAGLEAAEYATPAVSSTAKPAVIDLRSLIVQPRLPYLYPENSQLGNRTIVGCPLVPHRVGTR